MPHELVLSCKINEEPCQRLIEPHRTLLEYIRDDLGLTGSKHGCDVGDCGACTVMLDGQATLSCITLAAECEGREIRTVEGLADGGILSPLQDALHRHVAAQCGYCTPGIAMCLTALMEANDGKRPSPRMVREALGSNICRCTGYTKILSAVSEVLGHADAAAGEEGS